MHVYAQQLKAVITEVYIAMVRASAQAENYIIHGAKHLPSTNLTQEFKHKPTQYVCVRT